jgi:hypothetical protein
MPASVSLSHINGESECSPSLVKTHLTKTDVHDPTIKRLVRRTPAISEFINEEAPTIVVLYGIIEPAV